MPSHIAGPARVPHQHAMYGNGPLGQQPGGPVVPKPPPQLPLLEELSAHVCALAVRVVDSPCVHQLSFDILSENQDPIQGREAIGLRRAAAVLWHALPRTLEPLQTPPLPAQIHEAGGYLDAWLIEVDKVDRQIYWTPQSPEDLVARRCARPSAISMRA